MVGAGNASSEESDEVAKFFARFWEILVEAARRTLGKRPGWDPNDKQVAEALGVAASTVGHWRNGNHFPREKMVQSVLELAGPAFEEPCGFLAWRTKVHPLWEARGSMPRNGSVESASADILTVRATEIPPEPAVTEACDFSGTQTKGATALSVSTRLENGPDIPCDADNEIAHGPAEERGSDVTVSTQIRNEGRHFSPQDDEGPPEASRGEEPSDLLEKAANTLAKNVHVQWEDEAAQLGLDMPPPIPPRWSRTQRPITGPVGVAVGEPECRTRFSALPGVSPTMPDTVQDGGLSELFAVYAGLGSGRIFLMGHYGSGKTATVILTLLDALDRRVGLSPDMRAQTPVPVLLTARDWDPRLQSLGDWFAGQLATIYKFLQSPQYGPDAASELVRSGRVALFLDGFDEMDKRLQAAALRHINRQRRTFRLVVLTRIDDFTVVVEAERLHLYGAVALELLPVSRDYAVKYLGDCQRSPVPDGDELQKLIDHLRQHPDHLVSQALDTPLNLSLIREDPGAVNELLGSGSSRFQTREQVEVFLLGRVVRVNYWPNQPSVAAVQEWLGYLASQMDHNDLAWWRMHHWAPARGRCMINTLVGLVLMSGIGALMFGPLGKYTVTGIGALLFGWLGQHAAGGYTGTLFGTVYGAFMGGVFGFIAGLVSEFREPRPGRRTRIWSTVRRSRNLQPVLRVAFNPAIGLFIFAAVTMAVGNQSNLGLGLLAGTLAACAAGQAATRIRVTSSTRPWWTRLRPNRTDLLAALVIGLSIGLTYGFTKTPIFGTIAGLTSGLTLGFMVSVSRPISDTDTPPSPSSRWRQDCHRTLIVGLTAGIPIGLALGIQNGRAHGLLAGLTVALGHAAIIALASMVGISDIWRTTLLFAQLRRRGLFPLRGMRFLNNALEKRILRTAGAKIQFKHDRLRATLAETYQRSNKPPTRPATPPNPTNPRGDAN